MNDPVGVLLINLGTPEATSYWPMRSYLKEFLSDKRVIAASGPLWWLVFNGIILTKRPKKSGRAYDKIWNHALNESPLKTTTRAQCDRISEYFTDTPQIKVDWAMRYGQPAIKDAISRLTNEGCQRILFFPLYPQYSAATTATAMDKVFDALKAMRRQPAIRSVPPYFDDPAYINALVRSIKENQAKLLWKPDIIIASFHGLPVDFITKGDPYQAHCETTVALLQQALGLGDKELLLTYQSRTGRAVWIGPDTAETLVDIAGNGVKNVMVITPGFASDCIETLEEIEMRAAQDFKNNGGMEFSFVPCLNDGDASVEMLAKLIKRQLPGWLE